MPKQAKYFGRREGKMIRESPAKSGKRSGKKDVGGVRSRRGGSRMSRRRRGRR